MESLMQQVQRFFETDFRPERSVTKHGQMPHFMGPILWGILQMFPRDVVAPRYESNDLAVNATKSTAYVPKGAGVRVKW